jgi:hypothetical protein
MRRPAPACGGLRSRCRQACDQAGSLCIRRRVGIRSSASWAPRSARRPSLNSR